MECVKYAEGLEKRSKQQDTLLSKQKILISTQNELIQKKDRIYKRKSRNSKISFGLLGLIIGAFLALQI